MLVHIPSGLPSALEEIKINDNHLHAIDEDGLQGTKKTNIHHMNEYPSYVEHTYSPDPNLIALCVVKLYY